MWPCWLVLTGTILSAKKHFSAFVRNNLKSFLYKTNIWWVFGLVFTFMITWTYRKRSLTKCRLWNRCSRWVPLNMEPFATYSSKKKIYLLESLFETFAGWIILAHRVFFMLKRNYLPDFSHSQIRLIIKAVHISHLLTDTGRQFLGGPGPVGLAVAFGLAHQLEPLSALDHRTAAESVAVGGHPSVRDVAWLAAWASWGDKVGTVLSKATWRHAWKNLATTIGQL